MVTGASTANVAIILIDARNGVVEQTIRHAYIASLLNIPHIIVCINKMDMVGYSEEVFNTIRHNFEGVTSKLDIRDMHFLPISALKGDNVVKLSEKMDWYGGPPLMYLLENIHIASDYNLTDGRFPVQYIIRPNSGEFHDYRGYAGRIEGGIFSKGDEVTVLPSGLSTTIKTIDAFQESMEEAFAPQSVTLTLNDDVDISRGDMIVHKDNLPQIGQDIELMVCWLNEKPLVLNGKYHLKHTSNDARCVVKGIIYKVNINTLENNYDDNSIQMNDIARLKLRTTKPLFYDSYKKNRITGSLVLIDEGTNETICAGMII
jgi:sulfate adenylyltransferase subunit 1